MQQCLAMLDGEGIRDCRCASVKNQNQRLPSIIYPAYTRDSGFQEPSESLASQWQVAFAFMKGL